MVEDLIRRARLATFAFWAVIVADAAAIVTDLLYLNYLRTLPGEAVVAELEVVRVERFVAFTSIAQLLAILGTAVAQRHKARQSITETGHQ